MKKESWPVKGIEAKGTAKRRGNVAVPGAQRRWHRGPLVGGGSVGRGRPINMAAGEGVAEAHEGYAKGSFSGGMADGEGGTATLCPLRFCLASVTLSFFHPCEEKAARRRSPPRGRESTITRYAEYLCHVTACSDAVFDRLPRPPPCSIFRERSEHVFTRR